MASVSPASLPSVDATSTWHGTYEYRWRSSATGKEIYDLWWRDPQTDGSEGSLAQWTTTPGVHSIEVDTATNVWSDNGTGDPVNFSLSAGVITLSKSGDPNLYKFTKPTTADWISGGSGSGSGSSYPPPRTTRWISGAFTAIGVGWSTYQVYQTASGSSPVGGPGGGGWVYDLIQGDTANEVQVEIEVGADLTSSFSDQPGGIVGGDTTSVEPGDELFIEFDENHDDASENPNMTIDEEVTDATTTPPTTTNPSNTIDNTVTAGTTGSTVYTSIVCVRKPEGLIKVYIKGDTENEGIADTLVAQFALSTGRGGSHNFW